MAITCSIEVSAFYRFNKIFNGLTTKIYTRCIPFFAKVRYGIVTIVLFRVSMYCSALGMHWLNLQWPRNFCSVLSMVVCGPKPKGSLQRLLKVSQTSRMCPNGSSFLSSLVFTSSNRQSFISSNNLSRVNAALKCGKNLES